MNIDLNGIRFIETFEGFKSNPYLDIAGVPTIGYGTISYPNGTKVTIKDPEITEQQAEHFIIVELTNYVNGVNSCVHANLNQNQMNALYSFAYNLGVQALRTSTLLKLINTNPSDPEIQTEWIKWCHAGGNISQGLLNRRKKELQLYLS